MLSSRAAWMRPSLDWLLVFVPITAGVHLIRPDAHTAIFLCACIAILPLAAWLGRATEHLAHHTGEGVGGLLNATFGNAAELILALAALRQGLYDVVRASLTGSILGNILLVLGASFLAGGLKHPDQRFNASGARTQATMLTLAVIALVAPALYHGAGGGDPLREHALSFWISVVLLVTYALSLLFALRTHTHLFSSAAQPEQTGHAPWPLPKALAVLGASTAAVAAVSEILIHSVQPAAAALGMTNLFVGVIVVAVVGNAAEHSAAILMARQNKMDLSLGIAIGSSIQVALFVAPCLVLASYALGPRPLDLLFDPAEVAAVGLAVLITGQIAGDGESTWFEGVQLLSVYAILALLFFFLP